MEKRQTLFLHKKTHKDYRFGDDNCETAHMGTICFYSDI